MAYRFLIGFVLTAALWAHDPVTTKLTWTREISRIILERCGACHHDGGPAPMSLLNYEEARPWAKAIKEEVLERRMPPWGAVKGFGRFANDPSLSQEQIHLIADWVEGGAPEGDKSYLPVVPYIWSSPAAMKTAREMSERLVPTSLTVKALRIEGLKEGAAVKAIARTPDGSIIPLIWVYNFRSKWNQPYQLATPIRLPAGTTIVTQPAEAVRVILLEDVQKGALNAGQTNSRRLSLGDAVPDRKRR